MDLKSQFDLADELVEKGIISADQLAVAKVTQKKIGTDLSEILVRRGYLSKEALNEVISLKIHVASTSLDNFFPNKELLKALPWDLIRRARVVPYSLSQSKLKLAVSEPIPDTELDTLKEVLNGSDIEFVIVSQKDLDQCIEKFFSELPKMENGKLHLTEEQPSKSAEKPLVQNDDIELEPISHEEEENSQPVETSKKEEVKEYPEVNCSDTVALVNEIFLRAFKERASDLHLEPNRNNFRIRIRIDGILETMKEIALEYHPKVLSRIKILGNLDVAESRRPQDGGANIKIEDHEADLRMATYPTIFGEAAAIRISARENLITLEDMGLSDTDAKMFEELIKRPNGIILVTGPTGSGKTTSLYAALLKIDREKKHVLTAEDPAEREIEGVVQTQINPRAGVTFPLVLRGMLREDPDVIMVGEIRDDETAEISLRAAMTGHLVLSTLHTNSAIGAIARLGDLGLDTYLISSTLSGVMAQRLVRKICQKCREPHKISEQALKSLGPKAFGLEGFVGKGCEECNHKGYKGRLGIFEVIPVDDELRILINNNSPDVRLQEKASSLGCKTMLEDGIDKIRKGLTTVEEVVSVCRR